MNSFVLNSFCNSVHTSTGHILDMQAYRPWVCRVCQILADQLTLFQPGGTDYAHLITTGTLGFSDLPTALVLMLTYQPMII